jgi:hypothetical protein
MKKNILTLLALGVLIFVTSCKNDSIEFGDYDYQTVYFARQTPIRTITLGEDVYSTDLDNLHQFQVYARVAGVESNKSDRTINLTVDTALCTGLIYSDGSAVKPLPTSYYSLSGTTIKINSGEVTDCITVQLTDAFFNDTASTKLTYVLPLRMISASDSILSGTAKSGVTNPSLVKSTDWDVQPMNYTLYGLKYKNKYHGCWLCKGNDKYTTNGKDSTVSRVTEDWENASLVYLTTVGLKQSRYSISAKLNTLDEKGKNTVSEKTCSLILNFDANDSCTVTTDTPGCTATGSGQWTYHGLPLAWNKKDRDKLSLNYTVTFTYTSGTGQVTTTRTTTETLCMRDRQNKLEDFTYTIK